MGLFVAILFCLLVGTCFGQSTNKRMICKSVDDVFDDVTTTGVARRRNIGPPGKPGLPGISGDRGLPGLKGQAGEVDYSRLEKIVRARVSEETKGLEARVDEMNAKIQNMTHHAIAETRDLESRVDEMNAKIQNVTQTISAMCDGVIYNGRCFWAEIHSTTDTTIAKAQEICRKGGSRLADIYSRDHFDSVIKFLKSKLNGRSSIYVWTGMRKIYGNRNAQMSDNTQAPYTKARASRSDWNSASREYTHVYLLVRQPSYTGSDEGMGAVEPTWNRHGALCQSQ